MKIDLIIRDDEKAQKLMRNYALRAQNNGAEHGIDSVGSTATVCFLTPDKIYCANAGDCRAILCKKNDEITQLSYDHKPQNEKEIKRIKEAGHVVRFNRVDSTLAISRAIGDHKYKDKHLKQEEQAVTCVPDILEFDRDQENDEFILIACDGFWDVRPTKEVACDAVRECIYPNGFENKPTMDELVKGTKKLIDECWSRDRYANSGKGQDNITAVIVEFNK